MSMGFGAVEFVELIFAALIFFLMIWTQQSEFMLQVL